MGFHFVGQAGVELLTSGDLLASASQSAGITGMSHCTSHMLDFDSQQPANQSPLTSQRQFNYFNPESQAIQISPQ